MKDINDRLHKRILQFDRFIRENVYMEEIGLMCFFPSLFIKLNLYAWNAF